MSERNNSFDIIRHVAAYMVLFSHHFRLSGDHEPVFFNGIVMVRSQLQFSFVYLVS